MKNNLGKKMLLIIWDIFATIGAAMLSLLLIQDIDSGFLEHFHFIIYYSLVETLVVIVLMIIFRVYRSLLKYVSINEMVRIIIICLIVMFINIIVATITHKIPIAWCIVNAMLLCLFTAVSRYSSRLIKRYKTRQDISKKNCHQRVMVIGAGDAGVILIKEMLDSTEIAMKPCCLIDDDPTKCHMTVCGIEVVGNREDIPKVVIRYNIDLIIIAMPSVKSDIISDIIHICQDTKCRIQILPGIYQFVNGEVSVRNIRDVQIEDLLGREPVKIFNSAVNDDVKEKTVLITGGGGSIGSELCRQVACYKPKRLIVVDIYENNAYDIQMELKMKYPELDMVVLIASVRDKNKIEDIFKKYRPNIVCHAAAHKHVPLMEDSPNEAVKNNVFGTLNVAKAADKYNVDKFVLISTDKAVNPTNIMGATKRICEMIIQTVNKHSKTDFVAVRFGNVLGSNGSVIPLFKKQIAEGGPVTVTDRNITRYFMTIPEAVSLILQAGVFASGGEIFVLDMGKPVKIYDLAYNLIKLSGHIPNGDIKIKIVGLRPGEKLYEELLMSEEGLKTTENNRIHIGMPIELDEENFFSNLEELYKAAYEETDKMKELVAKLVPTYKIDHTHDH